MNEKMDMVVILLFEDEITEHLDGISEVMSHIPKYWSISDKSRENISKLFSKPVAISHTVKFTATFEDDKDSLRDLLDLVVEKGSVGGRNLILPDAAGVLRCKAAFAGEKGGVLKTYSNMLANSAARTGRTGTADEGDEESQNDLPVYGYYINLDERGEFYADVRNVDGKSVFEIRAGNSLGEDESSIFDDGFMRDKNDIQGLTTYLRDMALIPKDASILSMSTFEKEIESRQERAICRPGQPMTP